MDVCVYMEGKHMSKTRHCKKYKESSGVWLVITGLYDYETSDVNPADFNES